MQAEEKIFVRGSEWRQWDLHIHTPASFHWEGRKFNEDIHSELNIQLIDEMIDALNNSKPEVFALMDYWTFDGWFALQRRLKDPDAPKLNKTVFPGIELRLMSPLKKGRLNAHVIFSDCITEQQLKNFKSKLKIELIDEPLSNDGLINFARQHVLEEKLTKHNFKKEKVDTLDKEALHAGSSIAEINCDSYKDAIASVPKNLAVGFMPYNTNDGLSEIDLIEHYSYFLGLFDRSPIFETRNIDTWGAFVGKKTDGNSKWFDLFQTALGKIPRLAVSGSDAHQFKNNKVSNENRGYGDYPSEKITWIKADPTFQGLLQAIREPEKRSFIGKTPPKILEVEKNKTYFIDSLNIGKISDNNTGTWLSDCNILLNSDLVAIIGNKGSGKSALADVLALLGNSQQGKHFSFLQKNRFKGKTGEPAKHFHGKLTWLDANYKQRNLNDNPSKEEVELVRYIPQGHFEELCNDHVSRSSNAFEKELRSVIFSHTDISIRLGALDFDQLIDLQEESYRNQLSEYRNDIKDINDQISDIYNQLQPEKRIGIDKSLIVILHKIDEHKKIKPISISKPTDELTGDQKEASLVLDSIDKKIKKNEEDVVNIERSKLEEAKKLQATNNLKNRIELFRRSYKQLQEDIKEDLNIVEIELDTLINLQINTQAIDNLEESIGKKQTAIRESSDKLKAQKIKLEKKQNEQSEKLNGPQQKYQQNIKELEEWKIKLGSFVGTSDSPDTELGLRARLKQLDALPQKLDKLIQDRLTLSAEIFKVLDSQRGAREKLFKPVQNLINENSLIREEYKLQFEATLGVSPQSFAEELFTYIKQNTGDFRGEDVGYNTIIKIVEKYDFNKMDDILNFITEIDNKISETAKNNKQDVVGIQQLLRKGKNANDVYDFIFSLSFLEPRYSLLFQDAQIEQLSPGQRGALLLIFYLLVDKGRQPIILDQPEENLDNETVASLLVPVLSQAKEKRQIIMVTHNPNLAVVCDAEQIIYASFDRKDSFNISYLSGSIENPSINKCVVNVLEGRMPAFNNRRYKYI